ncbi:anthrax toxin-like adenylyl cyclase domain-containing protein [Providencia sp. Me31A]|uniref:anthrax toxin-like adenylyl cyclase domain-containing protein n=1 Tax=Providencia sp. Me31A TaxID=3392637 RepID=UPI003D2A2705
MNENKDVASSTLESSKEIMVNPSDYISVNLHLKPLTGTEQPVAIGIPVIHQKALANIANEENIIIGIRPVDTKSMSLIESGQYSSKNANVKGKSSDWGPHSGFIPVLQQFAKTSGRKQFDKYNHYVQDSLFKGYAVSIQLEISMQRIEELLKFGAISSLGPVDSNGFYPTIVTIDGQKQVFWLKKNDNTPSSLWKLYFQDGDKKVPFQVLGDPKTGKPLTADYDLFSIIYPFSELEHYVKVSEMPTWEEWKWSVNYDELTPKEKIFYDNEVEYNRYEGPDNKLINKKLKQIKDKINHQLGREQGFELVHHGAEDANPTSILSESFPITFFLPENLKGKNKLRGTEQSIDSYFPMNAQGSIIINDVEELSNFQQLLINQGYRAPLNKKWSIGDGSQFFDPKRKLSESFIEGLGSVAQKKSLVKISDDFMAELRLDGNKKSKQVNKELTNQKNSGFNNIYLKKGKKNYSSTLAGEHSSKTDSLQLWYNAINQYKATYLLHTQKEKTNLPPEYDYNVIIQLAGDVATTDSAANAFSKHPDNSMVIQYDLASQQYMVLNGELANALVGKTRWITIGHGDYEGKNQSTLYGNKTGKQFAEGMLYLKQKLFKGHNPNKLVMVGCDLSRGGVNENFAITMVAALGENNMTMPVVAYNRPIKVSETGNKLIMPFATEIEDSDAFPTKGFKYTYQYDPKTKQIQVNNQPLPLFFINELRRGELSFDQLTHNNKSDVMGIFRDPNTNQLDLDLLRKVSYNAEAYKLFVAESKKYVGQFPDSFYYDLSIQILEKGINETPLWKMVDSEQIRKYSSLVPKTDHASVKVIIRLFDDITGSKLAEKFAGTQPDDTIIIQMDINSKKWMIEYGEPSILSMIEDRRPVNWVLLGDSGTQHASNANLIAGLVEIKNEYSFLAPENILYHSLSPEAATEVAEHQRFIGELENSLRQQGIETTVSSKLTREATSTLLATKQGEAAKGYLSITRAQKIQALLENAALNQADITKLKLAEHPYLAADFMDVEGKFDLQKFKIALNDPLVSIAYNQALNRGETQLSPHLVASIEQQNNLHKDAVDILVLISAIKQNPAIINYLSENSIQRLQLLFPSINGFDRREILATLTDNNQYILLCNQLKAFSELAEHNFTADNAPFKSMSFSKAFRDFQHYQIERAQQYNQRINQSINHLSEGQLGLIDHGIIRKNGFSQQSDKQLGLAYGLEFHLSGQEEATRLFERQAQLEYKQSTKTEGEFILQKQLQEYTRNIPSLVLSDGIVLLDQSLAGFLKGIDSQDRKIIQLNGSNATYTVNFTQRNGQYEFNLFDPNGILLSVKHKNLSRAKTQFSKVIHDYFNEPIQLAEGQKTTRWQYAGFKKEPTGDIRFNIYQVTLDNPNVVELQSLRLQQRQRLLEHTDFTITKNQWAYFGDNRLSLMMLKNLGCTIKGHQISSKDIAVEGWQRHVRFDPDKLMTHLTLMEGSDADMALANLLVERQRQQTEVSYLIDGKSDFQQSAVLKKQLQCLAKGIENNKLAPPTIQKLRQIGTTIPRYQRLANRFGQVMGATGGIQSVIGVYTILNRLDNPDITKSDRQELEKQLYLSCASAFFNYGDMVVQPILTNIINARGATSIARARLAAGTVIVFNLAGMGIDAYQAYESLVKLESVTDVKQRQDLIVNAAFSLTSFAVNGMTVVGILASSSTIPVAGLVIGGVLIIGGWVYNGIRAVENIKEEIDISAGRELEEGIRGALGLEPTLRTQQEILIKRYIDAFKQADWENDLAYFEQFILQAGFDNHLSIIEKPIYRHVPKYYLVDQAGNYFGGNFVRTRSAMGMYHNKYIQAGAISLSYEDSERLLSNYYINPYGVARRLTDKAVEQTFKRKLKETTDLERTGSVTTHEFYQFNPEYQHSLLDKFKQKHFRNTKIPSSSTQQQLAESGAEQLNFYTRKTEFGPVGQLVFKGDVRQHSECIVDDKSRISLYLDNKDSQGTSFNSSNGNDIIIGKKNQRNAFQILSGEKYFAGGDKNDLFYLKDGELSSLLSNGAKSPTKYLDGQDGLDTLIIDNLPVSYRAYIDLMQNRVEYQKVGTHSSIAVAHLQGIENTVVRGNSNDIIRGDYNDNILDGGIGKDILMGFSGDDKLILTQGLASGGEGNDRYHIRRFTWHQQVSDLYETKRYYDNKSREFKNKQQLNPAYSQGQKTYIADIVIEEYTKTASIVNLEYTFNEINEVYVDGEHLYIHFTLPSETVGGKAFLNIKSQIKLQLNNVYNFTSQGRVPHHNYQIKTKDGFILDLILTPQDSHVPDLVRDKIFNISYHQAFDELVSNENKKVAFDEQKQTILIDNARQYKRPQWGEFIPIGLAENLIYKGSDSNNVLSHVKSGNHILVTPGIDTYQVTQIGHQQGDIVFDFSQMMKGLCEKDKVFLSLPTVNGYALKMEGKRLVLKNNFGETQLAIRFEHVTDNIKNNILLQDKYSNLFTVDLSAIENQIIPINPLAASTENDDVLLLPTGYISDADIIMGLGGDDVIINKSLHGYVLSGGEGNDTLKSESGHNVLYGGVGTNYLFAGDGDDLLLSSQGNDTLVGGKGDDHYVIDGHQAGVVYIDDVIGKNHLHLIGFKSQAIEENINDIDYLTYLSPIGKIVRVKQSRTGLEDYQVHYYDKLNDKYQSMMHNGMEPLVSYLAHQLSLSKANGIMEIWRPVDAIYDLLNGVNKSLTQTIGDDAITLFKESPRKHWLIDGLAGDDYIVDLSAHGRIIKGGLGNDKLITSHGENVLYGGRGDDILLAQNMGQDVLISLDGKDELAGDRGDDLYLVSGHGKGDVTISDLSGRNNVVLIDFNTDEVSYKEISSKLAETTYQSQTGRSVTIRHNNHTASTSNVTQVRHLKDYESLSKQNIDSTVEHLIQILAQQRIEHEMNFSSASHNEAQRNKWGAVQTTEHFLNNLQK